MVRRGERARSRSAESRLASRRVAERDVVDGRESRIAPVARERRVSPVRFRSRRKRNLTTATGRRAFAIPGRRRDARARRAV